MIKALRIILVVVVFVVFFEVGLFSSYTIVAAEAPDIQGLVDMQISKITGIFSSDTVNPLVKDPTVVNITNKKDVAQSMESLSNVDGVNVDSMNVTTYDDTDNKDLNVTIEALGYESPSSSNSSQIVISQDPSYKIVAEGSASLKNGELVVDSDSITIHSVLKLY